MNEAATDRRWAGLVADGSADLQTVVSASGEYLFVSLAGAAPFGWTPADLVGRAQLSFTHADDEAVLDEAHHRLFADGGSVTTVHRLRCKDGTYRWIEARARGAEFAGDEVVVASLRDIGERRTAELDLQRRAATDPLTGVANRTVFMDRLRHALRRLDRHDGVVAVLFLDLDRFKLINDTLGHHIGDAVLTEAAARLHQVLRPQDTLARLGGDEFAVVAEDLPSSDAAVALGARIVEAGRRPFQVEHEQFVCTTSAGIAVTADASHTAERLLQEADLALYRAKDRGRDRGDVFDEAMRIRATSRLGTERMLRRAIDDDRLRVHYQPVVDLRTGVTVAAEALVRVWEPDECELVVAGSFIEIAEEAGLLAAIDDWVLRHVVDQAVQWRNDFPELGIPQIAINVTARHIADAEFAQSLIEELAARDLPADALQIEVTERVLMEASTSAMTGLKALRVAGVKVGLDDFGTGYSSLSYLRLFPLDFVKIDQSFTQALASEGPGLAIVASIVELSHALGMTVVAEGVETQAQLDHLVDIGCDRAQGFHFAAAGTAGVIEQRVMHPRPSHDCASIGRQAARPLDLRAQSTA